jgi:hypothetical protein
VLGVANELDLIEELPGQHVRVGAPPSHDVSQSLTEQLGGAGVTEEEIRPVVRNGTPVDLVVRVARIVTGLTGRASVAWVVAPP